MTTVLGAALGLVVGVVIGTFGGGGGVLAVPALVYALGQDARTATTGSIMIVGVISIVGILARARGRALEWRTGIAFGVIGIPAAWVGTLLNGMAPQPVLLLSFAALTTSVAALMLVKGRARATADGPTAGDHDRAPTGGVRASVAIAERVPVRTSRRIPAVKVVLSATVVGFLTGFLGVGGGFLVVPALTLVLAMDMPAAIGTSLLVVGLNSISSLAARVDHLQLDWSVVLPFTAVAIVGALAGKLVADRLSSAALNHGFAVLLVAVGAFVGVDSLVSLAAS